jgi:hypothetical protein
VVHELPTLYGEDVLLRPFSFSDTAIVKEASKDALIPKITTVPTVDTEEELLPTHDFPREVPNAELTPQ